MLAKYMSHINRLVCVDGLVYAAPLAMWFAREAARQSYWYGFGVLAIGGTNAYNGQRR